MVFCIWENPEVFATVWTGITTYRAAISLHHHWQISPIAFEKRSATVTIFPLHLELLPSPLETRNSNRIQPTRNLRKDEKQLLVCPMVAEDTGEQNMEIRRWTMLTLAIYQRKKVTGKRSEWVY